MLRFFAAPSPVPSSSFRAVFEGVRDGSLDAGVVPVESSLAGDDPREPRPAVGVRPAGRGRGVRPGAARPARAAGGAPRDRRAGLLDRRGARPGRRLPAVPPVDGRDDLQHRGRGAAGRRARGAGRGGGRLARVAPIYGLEVLADDIQSGSDNHTRFAVVARREDAAAVLAAAAPAPWPGRRGPRSCSPSGTSPGSLYRALGAFATRGLNLVAAGVAPVDRARRRAGSTCSGSTSTRTRRNRPAPRRSRRWARRPRWSGSWAPTPAPPRTDDPGIGTASRAGAARRRLWWRR